MQIAPIAPPARIEHRQQLSRRGRLRRHDHRCRAPGYWNDLPKELAAMGRSLDDVQRSC